MFLRLGSDSWSLMESLTPVNRQICLELTPFLPMIGPASEPSTLTFAVAEAPKPTAAAWLAAGLKSIRGPPPPNRFPGAGPIARGSS
ncbi:hypothetical protein HanIR_Chr02g0096071 [Helianthus annuus]|nr:hypothetical protein HanIR_Chr02g0096071 [Helianthus annuus]KAJ0620016.1 hypothetical protein HanHA89_Chr02g0077721 [Helianthus annuus]